MFTVRRSRSLFLGSAAFLALALFAPGVVSADEAIPLVAPVAGPATDAAPVVAPVAAPSWDETSGYGSVEATRALAAERALQIGDLGSMQEERLLAIVAAVPSWDETGGYRSVEASRAANAMPAAPAASTTVEETRVLAAQQALQSSDLGSLQEEALLAVVVTGSSWDQTSGYASVEASRAMIGHPTTSTTSETALLAEFRAVEQALSRYLGTD
jgi:hypothetical protein